MADATLWQRRLGIGTVAPAGQQRRRPGGRGSQSLTPARRQGRHSRRAASGPRRRRVTGGPVPRHGCSPVQRGPELVDKRVTGQLWAKSVIRRPCDCNPRRNPAADVHCPVPLPVRCSVRTRYCWRSVLLIREPIDRARRGRGRTFSVDLNQI